MRKDRMKLFLFSLPILIIISSNIVYNISTKAAPKKINQFAVLVVAYFIATIISLLILFITSKGSVSVAIGEITKTNWSSYILAIGIVALEFGYLSAFKVGWQISKCSIVANICLAIVLVIIGALFYKEKISLNHLIGMGLCISGLIVMNR